jgi:glycosyltransferase involved in cell wall biosynthesis
MTSDPLRFAVVISHPIQHYSPFFRELNKVPGMRVKVFYLCDHGVRKSYDPGFETSFTWDVPLLEGYEYEILRPGFSPRRFGFLEVDDPKINACLEDFQPQALWIHGYGQRICWRALLWAAGRASVIYFGDSELLRARPLVSRILKRIFLPWFFRRCDAFITIGDNNETFYRHYGVPSERFSRGACPVDLSRFFAAASASFAERREVRMRYQLPHDAFVVLFSGKIEAQKRPLDLVQAVASSECRKANVHALFIGDGPLRKKTEERARELGISSNVTVTGFVNQSEMPHTMLAGDALAVVSERDAHPLAVTEALAIGLPVVVSDRVGCVGPTDSARPDVNAIVYPCGDTHSLAASLVRLAGVPELRQSMATASRKLAATQDLPVTVNAVLAALRNQKKVAMAQALQQDNISCDSDSTSH